MVVISNGYQKFHLAWAAAEAHKRGQLSLFLTGAYPTERLSKLATAAGLASNRRFNRLLARRESIPEKLVAGHWWSEGLYQVGRLIDSFSSLESTAALVTAASMRLYSSAATSRVLQAAAAGARIYHYRSGFGLGSVRAAKQSGMFALCDHSLAHPALIERLVVNDGRLGLSTADDRIDPMWRLVLEDTKLADAVLVNSDFVRDTFLHQGWLPDRVNVIYQGVDDSFLRLADSLRADARRQTSEFRLLFPGSIFNKRKGAHILIQALATLPQNSWRLEIAGGIGNDVEERYSDFLSDARVTQLGTLSRLELAQAFNRTEVVILPSLAEGSARVIFEALACGRYVITTPNSGSIIGAAGGGTIVPPGAPEALASAIGRAMERRPSLDEAASRAKNLVRANYRQSSYGDALHALYARLLTTTTQQRAA